MRVLAGAEGRSLRFGIRLHVITRDRAADAWAETERLLAERWTPGPSRRAQAGFAQLRVGRPTAAWPRSTAAPRSASSWRPTCGPGSGWCGAAPERPSSVATTRWRSASWSTTTLGFDEFILSGHPHLEEAYWFGEGVMPVLRRAGVLASPGATGDTTGPDVDTSGDPAQAPLTAMSAR